MTRQKKSDLLIVRFVLSLSLSAMCGCSLTLAPTISADYDWDSTTETYSFRWSSPGEEYLARLRTTFNLDDVVVGATSDIERVEAICAWVHSRWEHSSWNTPAQNDPIYILDQAAQGRQFRCVEYGIVIAGCLAAIGIPARVLNLKTKDVETRISSAMHVAAEAYLPDLAKWVLADGQYGVIPFSADAPLSGLEFMRALAQGDGTLTLWSAEPTEAAEYYDWISDYLYFFDVAFDNRVGDAVPDRDRQGLMLVPLGEKNPVVTQRYNYIGDRYTYTHEVNAFYAVP